MTAHTTRVQSEDGGPEMDFVLDSYKTKKLTDAFKNPPRTIFGIPIGDIAWFNVAAFVYLHVSALTAVYAILAGNITLNGFIFGFCYGIASAIGVTGGAHRLWAHGAYKAKWPLRVILITLQTAAFQNSVWEWVRDHRVHHKYTDTDADPHNFGRGFFFAHMGWLMVRKHPLVKEKGARIDLSDIESDPICMFQKRYFLLLMPVLAFGLPTYINVAVFQMPFWTALHCTNLRYMLSLHVAWLVNSAAHCWGHRPFDSSIQPVNNRLLAYMILGEGWHNYHHVFPWDYKTAEYGTYFLNATTAVIDFFALFGWAYDLKVVARPMLMQRAMRTGDGTFRSWKQDPTPAKGDIVEGQTDTDSDRVNQGVMLWGWEDTDLPERAKKFVNILNKVD